MSTFEVTLHQPGVYNPSTGKAVTYTLYEVGSGDNDYLLNGTIKLEVNKAGTFEFDILPSHSYYSVLRRYIHYICVKEFDTGVYTNYDDVELPDDIVIENGGVETGDDVKPIIDLGDTQIVFYGRILSMSLSFNGTKHVVCEGLMANLLDCPMYNPFATSADKIFTIGGTPYEMFFTAINAYRNRIRPDIFLGNADDKTTDYELEDIDVSGGTSVGDFITSELVEAHGGYLRMDYLELGSGDVLGFLYWDAEPELNTSMTSYNSATTGQVISFGENLLDLNAEASDDEIMTGIVPCWEDSNNEKHWVTVTGSDIDSIETRSIYMPYIAGAQSGLGAVGITVVELPGTKSQAKAIQYASNYVSKYCSNYILSSGVNVDFDSFTVRALDMHYMDMDSNERVWLYDRVRVKCAPHSIDRILLCSSIEIPIDNPFNSSYTFSIYRPKASSNDKVLTRQIKRKRF